jgi:hypothetical protein
MCNIYTYTYPFRSCNTVKTRVVSLIQTEKLRCKYCHVSWQRDKKLMGSGLGEAVYWITRLNYNYSHSEITSSRRCDPTSPSSLTFLLLVLGSAGFFCSQLCSVLHWSGLLSGLLWSDLFSILLWSDLRSGLAWSGLLYSIVGRTRRHLLEGFRFPS